jgi:hypothetical protein
MWLPACLAAFCGVVPGAALRGDEPPRPPGGQALLASGRVVEYTIHFDRNSFRDSVRVGDNLIALTSSGTLLRFELPAVRLAAERIGVDEVACLARGEGDSVLAGLSDGRVCRVDPATLALSDAARLPGEPGWVGWLRAFDDRPAGVVAVTRRTRPLERDGERWEQPYSVIHDVASGRTLDLEFVATAILLDGTGRLWLGADRGEWGGRVARADLRQGTVAEIRPPRPGEVGSTSWEGVYGFIELRDGQVWAFGGTSHFGLNSGSITRVDEAEPRPLLAFRNLPDPEREPDPGRPLMPITHVLEEGGGVLVFSYSDVFRADRGLTSWKKVATLEIRYRWGRPDAMGAYPSVRAVHPPRREGEPYVLATVADGYVLLEGAAARSHALPGQLGASAIDGVRNTLEGTVFLQGDEDDAWRLVDEGWDVASLAPPVEPDPASDFAGWEKDRGWNETRVLVGPDGTIFTVSGTGNSPGTRTTARRIDGKPARIGRETSSLWPSRSFLTADGTLWNADGRNLKRFEQGAWETVARLPRRASRLDLEPLNTDGPPWLLLCRSSHDLWRLDHGARGSDPRMTRIALREGEQTLQVKAAIPWGDGALLLATDSGLRAFDAGAPRLSRVDFPEPEHPASVLTRDARGRLWLGGKHGLWLSERGEKAAESLGPVPWVGRSPVFNLAPDPRHDDGVIAALGSRGVAFVRSGQGR